MGKPSILHCAINEAEDIVQTAFINTLTPIGRFERRANLCTGLYRAAYKAAIDRTQ